MIKRNDDSKSRVAWQLLKLETIATALILLAVDGNAQATFGRDTRPLVITVTASPSYCGHRTAVLFWSPFQDASKTPASIPVHQHSQSGTNMRPFNRAAP